MLGIALDRVERTRQHALARVLGVNLDEGAVQLEGEGTPASVRYHEYRGKTPDQRFRIEQDEVDTGPHSYITVPFGEIRERSGNEAER